MRFKEFQWDDNNVNHIAEHGVTSVEVEEACFNAPIIFKSRLDRYYVLGQTDSGRYLTVIVSPLAHGIIRVITARGMSKTERQRFHRK